MTRRRLVLVVGGVAVVAIVVFQGWFRSGEERSVVWSDLPVAILQPVMETAPDQGTLAVCTKLFPDAIDVDHASLADDLRICLEQSRTLLVPESKHLPLEALPALDAYVQRGGSLLFLGSSPFEARVWKDASTYLSEGQLYETLVENAQSVSGLSRVQVWRREKAQGTMADPARLVRDKRVPWSAVEVSLDDVVERDVLASPDIEPGTISEETNVLLFFARGDRNTSRLRVEVETHSGDRWETTILVKSTWSRMVLHASAFSRVDDANPGAQFNLKFAWIKNVRVGLWPSRQLVSSGKHLFGLSDVRLGVDPRPSTTVRVQPDLFPSLHAGNRYVVEADRAEHLSSGRSYAFARSALQSVLPGPRGWGAIAAPLRWIPLFEVRDDDGHVAGWPASLFVRLDEAGRPQVYGWIGLDVSAGQKKIFEAMVLDAVERLHLKWFLHAAGTPTFTVEPASRIRVRATCLTGRETGRPRRVAAELVDSRGDVIRRVVSQKLSGGEATESLLLDLGLAPAVRNEAADYAIHLYLEETQDQGNRYDTLRYPIKVLEPSRSVGDEAWVKATGPRFTLGKRPLFVLGTNYEPLRADTEILSRHWLEATQFDPLLVVRDLDHLASTGINTLSIVYSGIEQAPQLRYVLRACRDRDLWVYLSLPQLDPLKPDLEEAQRMIDAAELRNEERVLALELGTRGDLGSGHDRDAFDASWRNWLGEQFGSLQRADTVVPGLRKEKGRVVGPSDQDLSRDGPHRAAVALYRRFVEDELSRGTGRVVRFLREHGIRQLLGARRGSMRWGIAAADARFPLDMASAAAHLDFISLSAHRAGTHKQHLHALKLATLYARGVSDGKPVLWRESGAPPVPDSTRIERAEEERLYGELVETLLSVKGAGFMVGPHPASPRARGSAMLDTDGSLKAVKAPVQRLANRLRYSRGIPRAWKGKEVNRFADARGSAAFGDLAKGRTDADEIRLRGFGESTREVLFELPGGLPYTEPSPLHGINAEWAGVVVNGRPLERDEKGLFRLHVRDVVRLTLLNPGATRWYASDEQDRGSVWLEAGHEVRRPTYQPLPSLGFGERADIEWVARDSGRWVLRPYLAGVGGFGEPLEVEVEAKPLQKAPRLRF